MEEATTEEQPHILVVDDERGIVEMISLCLRKFGYKITTANSAELAYEAVNTTNITVIITDVMMPGEDGISFLGKVHAKYPDIPVIIMTGYAQLQMAVNAIKNGAFDFIHKPFDFKYLSTVIEKAVRYAALVRHEKQYKENLERTVEQRTLELTNAVKQLDAANIELRTAFNEKSVFVATLSHEMRTPMNGVIGGLDLLEDAGLAGEQLTYLHLVRHAADSMLELVERMLAFSDRAGRGAIIHSTTFDVFSLIGSVTETHNDKFKEKNLQFDCRLQQGTPQYIRSDKEQIIRLLDILLNNACKFTDKGNVTLDISLEQASTSSAVLVLSVSDSGVGIAADMIDRIFEPFTQADGASTRRFGGMGLGLGIANNIVSMLHGKITVDSSPGVGSCFRCEIPCEIVPIGEPL